MFCNNCGTVLSEGIQFCVKCGATQDILKPTLKRKRRRWWMPIALILMLMGLLYFQIISVDACLSRVVEINMRDYYPIKEGEYVLIGEFESGIEMIYESEIYDKVEIDDEIYFIRKTKMTLSGNGSEKIGLIFREKNSDVYIFSQPILPEYDFEQDYWEALSQSEAYIFLPGKLKFKETKNYWSETLTTKCTLLGFKNIRTSLGTFRNTAVVERINDYDDGSQYKLINYYAKGIGEVKTESYIWDEDEEDWVKNYELERD